MKLHVLFGLINQKISLKYIDPLIFHDVSFLQQLHFQLLKSSSFLTDNQISLILILRNITNRSKFLD